MHTFKNVEFIWSNSYMMSTDAILLHKDGLLFRFISLNYSHLRLGHFAYTTLMILPMKLNIPNCHYIQKNMSTSSKNMVFFMERKPCIHQASLCPEVLKTCPERGRLGRVDHTFCIKAVNLIKVSMGAGDRVSCRIIPQCPRGYPLKRLNSPP